MGHEIINRIEILDTGQLFLGLESQGDSIYQYIYRAGSGVCWDENRHGFKSTPLDEWSCSKWFFQIVLTAKSELGLELSIGQDAIWHNIPAQERTVIENGNAI